MTKVIGAIFIVLVLLGIWEGYFYWERVKNEQENQKKAVAATAVVPEQLPGMAPGLEASLQAALKQGPAAMRVWLRTYGRSLQDPRKAWIQLDYCQIISRDDPAEARRLYAEVKERILESSPVYPRLKQLEKTYQ